MNNPGTTPKPGEPEPSWRADKRTAIDEVFETAEPEDPSCFDSPSGKYCLEVTAFRPESGWKVSEGIVRASNEAEPLAVVRRNYGQFPFTWCEGHPNRHDYLVCGEDYQGQTILELDTGKRADFLADQAEAGFGWCWGQHHLSPDKDILVVDGCYWACPYELVVFDFSDPMNLPYPELHRWAGELSEVHGFDAAGTLTWTFEREVRLSDGKAYDDLTESENAELLEADGTLISGLLGSHSYRSAWTAGEPFAATTTELVNQ